MTTTSNSRISLSPVAASTIRQSRHQCQHLKAAPHQPFLDFQFFLGPYPLCTILERAGGAQQLPQQTPLSAFRPDDLPDPIEDPLNETNQSEAKSTPKSTIPKNFFENLTQIRPAFLEGYPRIGVTHLPSDNPVASRAGASVGKCL